MKLTPSDKLAPLLVAYPSLVDFLAGYSPNFEKLKNPLLRKTVGRLATLDQVARMGDIPVDQLLRAVAAEIGRAAGQDVQVEIGGAPAGPAAFTDRESRKEVLKDIIRDLHRGGDVETLRKRFAELVAGVSGAEIAAMEQELMAEGLPQEQVKKLCDIHVEVFKDALDENPELSAVPGHPLHTLAAENRALENLVAEIRAVLSELALSAAPADSAGERRKLLPLLESLAQVEKHYLKKENQLFPALEAKGVSGPSKVMWAIHDDIRAHLKDFRRAVEENDPTLAAKAGAFVLAEITDMIYKEEKIFFPMCLETLGDGDWARVKKGEEEVGYAWVEPGREWTPVIPAGEGEGQAPGPGRGEASALVDLDTGALPPELINLMLCRLPVDVSFVDERDTVRYYSASPDRVFPRSPGIIGRTVQNCHPPKSLEVVNSILAAFKAGTRDEAEFWIEMRGRFIHIRYFAVRDAGGRYRGCLEVSQDVTGIRTLRGEKRLLDWK